MSVELVVFSGLQAAGKSTYYQTRYASTHALVSKDAWPNAANRERRQRSLVAAHLTAGRSVVVDNTNPTVGSRAPLVEIARRCGARVVSVAFVIEFAEAVRRNALRSGRARVPDVGLRVVASQLTLPTPDEGFDEYVVVRGDPEVVSG